jgi:hypothetical protein
VFVVDDILISYFVLPYAQEKLNQGRNQLYDWLDKQGVKLARRGLRFWQHKPSDVEVLKELGHYVETHPGTASTLATATITAQLQAATRLPAGQRDEKFLNIVLDFLNQIFEMVQELGSPVVLPGFLTGTDDLAVIDVRTVPLGGQLELPWISGGQVNPTIMLWRDLGPVGKVYWMPRIWLVRAATDADRDRYKEFANPDTTPKQLADELKDQPFVMSITRRYVVAQHVQMVLDHLPPTKTGTGEDDRIPWAESPDGVKAMLAALTSQLGERLDEDVLWLRALAALSP